jgi:hypothetical protein
MALIADTGSPVHAVIAVAALARVKLAEAPGLRSNFGEMTAGWACLAMGDLGLET